MVFSNKGSEPKRRWFFRPVYLLIIWGLLALLLIVNGTYESERAQGNLYRMLFDEGSTIIAGLEKNAQNIFASLTAVETVPEASPFIVASSLNLLELEDAVADLLLDSAFQVDRELGNRQIQERELSKIAEAAHLSGLELITPEEKIVYSRRGETVPSQDRQSFYEPLLEGRATYAIQRSEKKGTGQMDHLSVAVVRKAGGGILILHADEGELRLFRRRVILQGLIEEWRGKGETRYISFQGEDGEIWANTDQEKIGKKEQTPFSKEVWQKDLHTPGPESKREQGIFEVAKVVSLDPTTHTLLRVGLSAGRVEEIVAADRRNMILFSLMLLVFGGMGMTFIYRMESRHLERMREMEEKIHQTEKISSLANLAAGVAHEIRNPLNAIGMAIQRLQREFAPQPPELQKEYYQFTDVLRGEVGRVNEIIEQFLFFARPARLDLKPTQIGDLLRDLLLLCREMAEHQHVILEPKIEPHLPPLKLDRQRMQEALWNLINNGLQAMPNGGVLHLAANLQDGQVRIQISDTGKGIPEENLSKIFDYYFTTKEKGTGLGLPLAHKIIQEHGGSIEVQSVVSNGTTFQVYLPLPGGGE